MVFKNSSLKTPIEYYNYRSLQTSSLSTAEPVPTRAPRTPHAHAPMTSTKRGFIMTPIDQGFNDIGSSQSSLFSIAIRFHPNPDPDPDKRSSRDDDVSTARVQAEKLSRKNSVSGAWHSLRASLPAAQLTGPGADPSQERLKSIPTALWQNRSPSLFAAVG
ncbi:hypothetical protein P167DRAFT_562164 [Morchella conica CCBAS932]|uniref:Uncharacterized protein n=1 Tax=Morchella conica CCBAS932 TaxID=1392247 RepID=A0A3N4L1E5_9PEZI|nr:hypothetical protein P167DRAFT_562164 [Morchella conica CCBAS932]